MQAFDSLVVDDDTKELVKALVTNQLAREKATDLMDGKGNGLVILLHGFAPHLTMTCGVLTRPGVLERGKLLLLVSG
jgi:hypothetical protein